MSETEKWSEALGLLGEAGDQEAMARWVTVKRVCGWLCGVCVRVHVCACVWRSCVRGVACTALFQAQNAGSVDHSRA